MLPTASPELYGGFWQRFGALLLDYLLFVLAWALLLLGASQFSGAVTGFIGWTSGSFLLLALGAWLYWAGFESSPLMATPAKYASGLRVTDMDGKRISFIRATVRFFAKLLSYLPFCAGFVLAGVTLRKQALHDLIARTVVVHARSLAEAAGGELESG